MNYWGECSNNATLLTTHIINVTVQHNKNSKKIILDQSACILPKHLIQRQMSFVKRFLYLHAPPDIYKEFWPDHQKIISYLKIRTKLKYFILVSILIIIYFFLLLRLMSRINLCFESCRCLCWFIRNLSPFHVSRVYFNKGVFQYFFVLFFFSLPTYIYVVRCKFL